MIRDGHNNVRFFIGGEVEKTPAFSRKTLFVVGEQNIADIVAAATEHKVTHVFMGANHSFDTATMSDSKYWDATITTLLDFGIMVTLDYQAHQHETVLKMLNAGIWQSRLFVPLLAVRIPKIQTSNVNLTVKIDDIDFNATNPGVWCMHFHEVTDSNRFTDWQEYETDQVLGDATPSTVSEVPPVSIPAEKQTLVEFIAPAPAAQNSTELGLDVAPTTSLKADPDAVVVAPTPSVDDTLAAYAEAVVATPTKKLPKAPK